MSTGSVLPDDGLSLSVYLKILGIGHTPPQIHHIHTNCLLFRNIQHLFNVLVSESFVISFFGLVRIIIIFVDISDQKSGTHTLQLHLWSWRTFHALLHVSNKRTLTLHNLLCREFCIVISWLQMEKPEKKLKTGFTAFNELCFSPIFHFIPVDLALFQFYRIELDCNTVITIQYRF